VDNCLRVGLVWAGNAFKKDVTRSLRLEQLSPLQAVSGVKFYSLQKGPGAQQAKQPPAGMKLIDLGPELTDFADTAAVMSLMDLIITTDTAASHLAGALAKPTWLLLQFIADWRWMPKGNESPWYPTLRLFRQTRWGDWDGPIREVADELTRFCPIRQRPNATGE
jgi:hypothetical protein